MAIAALWLKGAHWWVGLGGYVAGDLIPLIGTLPVLFQHRWWWAGLHLLATLAFVWAVFNFGPLALSKAGLID